SERVEVCATAADVAGNGEPCAAAQRADERRAPVEQSTGALDLECEQTVVGVAFELTGGDAVALEIVRGQVDAAALVVLVHVLPVLEQLQRRAHRVRLGDARRRCGV